MRTVSVSLLGLLAVLVLGCASAVPGTGVAGTPTATSPTSGSGGFPTPSTSGPSTSGGFPSTSSVPPTTPTTAGSAGSTRPVPAGKITVDFRTPYGFSSRDDYHPTTPLEPDYKATYFIPAADHAENDVLSLTLYQVAGTVPRTDSDQRAKIKAYDTKAKATQLTALSPVVIDRIAGYAEQATDSGLKYESIYVFLNTSFLLVTCQYDTHLDIIKRGCVDLVGSIRFT